MMVLERSGAADSNTIRVWSWCWPILLSVTWLKAQTPLFHPNSSKTADKYLACRWLMTL
jgi:hypothetical protein